METVIYFAFILCTIAKAQITLTTPFRTTSYTTAPSGNMFDVANRGSTTLTITRFDINVDAGGFNDWNVTIYTKLDTYVGYEVTPEAWTMVYQESRSGGGGQLSDFQTTVPIAAGDKQAFLVYVTAITYYYSTGTTDDALLASDSNLAIYEGNLVSGPVFAFNYHYGPKAFRGTIYYSLTMGTAQPTTSLPTTNIPTSNMPTTSIQTSNNPTTTIPTTYGPKSATPTTTIPTTIMPTTSIPTTVSPTTSIPSTLLPTTTSPTTTSPTTTAPTTTAPSNNPTTSIPTTYGPTSANPTTNIPTLNVPSTTIPSIIIPTSTAIPTYVPVHAGNEVYETTNTPNATGDNLPKSDDNMDSLFDGKLWLLFVVISTCIICVVIVVVIFVVYIKKRRNKKHENTNNCIELNVLDSSPVSPKQSFMTIHSQSTIENVTYFDDADGLYTTNTSTPYTSETAGNDGNNINKTRSSDNINSGGEGDGDGDSGNDSDDGMYTIPKVQTPLTPGNMHITKGNNESDNDIYCKSNNGTETKRN